MEGSARNSNYSIHIHNFSLVAIRSYILEVKKYPIIYNGNTQVPSSFALINYAWARIVAALLDNSVHFDLAQRRGYWDRSFRELWKWMRLILIEDMLSRRRNSTYIRSPEHVWLQFLKFLEPYIQSSGCLVNGHDIDSQLDPDIHIQIHSEGILNIKANNPTVIWLRDSSEDPDSQSMYISICLRTPPEVAVDFNINPSELIDIFQPTENDNTQIIGSPKDSVGFSDENASQAQVEQAAVPFPETHKVEKDMEQDAIVPWQSGSVSTVIDEDFKYIMSFLPILQELEPMRNAEMKVMMIDALHEVL